MTQIGIEARWNNVTTYWSDLTKQNCADKRESKLSFIRDKTFLATVPLSKWHSALVLMYHQERGYTVNHNHILLIFRWIILSEIFFVIYQKFPLGRVRSRQFTSHCLFNNNCAPDRFKMSKFLECSLSILEIYMIVKR